MGIRYTLLHIPVTIAFHRALRLSVEMAPTVSVNIEAAPVLTTAGWPSGYNRNMDLVKEHWFKVGILTVLLIFAASPAYYFVYYIPHRDAVEQAAAAAEGAKQQAEQEKEQLAMQQAAAEAKNWADLKAQVNTSLGGAETVNSAAQEIYDNNRTWLNDAYSKEGNPYYSYLLPLVTATEHYQQTLQSLINSLSALSTIRYKMLTAIADQDSDTLQSLATNESSAVDNMKYWYQQQQAEDASVKAIQTQVIKNIGSQNSGY
jgi:hypothetical protein